MAGPLILICTFIRRCFWESESIFFSDQTPKSSFYRGLKIDIGHRLTGERKSLISKIESKTQKK